MNEKPHRVRPFALLIRHDVIYGIVFEWKKYVAVIVIFSLLCASFAHLVFLERLYGTIHVWPDYADYFIDIFKGMKLFVPGKTNREFSVPAKWLLLQVAIVFLVSNYPLTDLSSYGQQVIIRLKHRRQWWFSKCVWVCCTVVLFYLLGYFVLFLFCLGSGGVSFQPDVSLNLFVSQVNSSKLSPGLLVVSGILLPILTSTALSLFQMLISFLSNSMLGCITIITVLVLSAYQCDMLLPGNYLMLLRNMLVTPGGVSTENGIFLDACLIVISVLAGEWLFSKYDILNRKE